MNAYTNIDEYIANFPPKTQVVLRKMRATMKKLIPDGVETISYAIPTFDLHGHVVHFAGYEHHVGLYPGAVGIVRFQKEISEYKHSKGAVQFPLDQPIPWELITKIVQFCRAENIARWEAKQGKGKVKAKK